MKVLVIPDIHGRHEKLQTAFDKFLDKGYDKVVLLGDLADSYDRSNEDILRCFKIAFDMKEKLGDKMEWLIGNHELSYMFAWQQCSGYRPDLAATLNPWLVDNRHLLKVAYQEGNHLFTHAGICKGWMQKHMKTIASMIHKYSWDPGNYEQILNGMFQTAEGANVIMEFGMPTGGMRGDIGGPLWCRPSEMDAYGPVPGLHQYVGHTPQKFVNKVIKFEGGKSYNNTSVTYCDVIEREEKFWTKVEI